MPHILFFRLLWISRANRREGKMFSTMLVEKSEGWLDKMFRGKR
jgi:hypothetical protein